MMTEDGQRKSSGKGTQYPKSPMSLFPLSFLNIKMKVISIILCRLIYYFVMRMFRYR